MKYPVDPIAVLDLEIPIELLIDALADAELDQLAARAAHASRPTVDTFFRCDELVRTIAVLGYAVRRRELLEPAPVDPDFAWADELHAKYAARVADARESS